MTVKGWQDFLDSLATAGGNIVTLSWCSVTTGIAFAWVVKYGDPNLITPMFGVFTGFTGALLQAQKGNASRQQMVDRAAGVNPPTSAASVVELPVAESPKP